MPVIVSVNFIEGNIVLDLNDDEELCVDASLHVSIDFNGDIRGMVKEHPGSLAFSQVLEAITVAKCVAKQVFDKVDDQIIKYKV